MLRRRQHINHADTQLQRRLEQTSALVTESALKWSSVIKEQNYQAAKIIFRGEPFIQDFLASRREFVAANTSAFYRNFNFTDDARRNYQEQDIFAFEVAGTSLSDIEKMPLPLSLDDIRRVNKMFFQGRFTKKRSEKQLAVIYGAIYLSSQKLARDDLNIDIPKGLRPLYDRLCDYLDYYTDLMTNFSLDAKDDLDFYKALKDGYPYLLIALGNYIPAKFGITPASAIKIYHQHFNKSFISFALKKFLNHLEEQSKHAIGKILPEDLVLFAQFDPQKDQRAAKLLFDFYQAQNKDNSTQMDVYNKSNEYLNRLSMYQKVIRSDIASSGNKRIELPLPEDNIAHKLTVTSQNRKTLIFITHFKDGSTHLTLEIDRDGVIFGIPPQLIRDNPRIADFMLIETLAPVLEKAKKDHPGLESPPAIEPPRTHEGQTAETETVAIKPAYVPAPKEKKTGKPQTAKAALPERQQPPQQKFVVLHTKSSVKELAGKNPQEKDLERIMRTIRNYEYGYVQSKTIDWSGGHVQALRVGKYRIILRHLKGRFYAAEAVGRRANVYDNYADDPKV